MNTNDFNRPLNSDALNESLEKAYNVRINFDKYTREQLENYRNLLRTKVHQVENAANFNELLSNEVYQKDKFVLNVLNTRIKEMLGEGKEVVAEKAKSKAQQKFMGMVHAAQKGEKPASKEVAKVAKGMSKKAAKDYASTKHKGLPAHVDEEQVNELSPELIRTAQAKRHGQLTNLARTGQARMRNGNDTGAKASRQSINQFHDTEANAINRDFDQAQRTSARYDPAERDAAHANNERNRVRNMSRGNMLNVANKKLQGTANVSANPAQVSEVSASFVKKHLQKSWDQQDSVNDRLKAGEPVSRKELKRSIRGEKNADLAVSKLRGTAKVPATSMTEGQTDRSIETYFRDEPVEVSYDFDEYGEIEITGVYNPKTGEDFSDDITSNELHLLASEVYDYLENERDEKGDWEHEMRRDRGFSESRAGNIKGRSKSAKSVEKGTKMKKKSNVKPDFLDKDGDGNKKEPFKKAAKDAKKKAVKESIHDLRHRAYQNFIAEGLAQLLAEDEEGKAKAITAGADMVNDFTSWMQRVGNYQTKSMIELADNIRANFGVQQAETFKASVGQALEGALNALTTAREEINNAVAVLAGEAPPAEPMGQEPAMPGEPGMGGDVRDLDAASPDAMNLPSMDDEFAASDAAAGGMETSGRMKRESIERGNRLMKILGA